MKSGETRNIWKHQHDSFPMRGFIHLYQTSASEIRIIQILRYEKADIS